MSQHAVDDPRSTSEQRLATRSVVLLCGLPGSGKTTLARQLVEHYGNCAIHMEYDELEDSLASTTPEGSDRRQAWNEARQIALKQLEERLGDEDSTFRIFLIDDNFHLRGMRKQIHRLLLDYQPIRFGILWMETPFVECVRRNQSRKRQIPAHVMEKMNEIIEPPRAAWEENWLKVDQRTPFETVAMFVDECPEISDLPVTINEVKQEADRQITLASQSHNLDNILRGWVRKVALYDKNLAKQANEARKELMREMNEVAHDRSEEDRCAQFVSLVMPDDQNGNRLRLLQLLKS